MSVIWKPAQICSYFLPIKASNSHNFYLLYIFIIANYKKPGTDNIVLNIDTGRVDTDSI